MVQARRPPPDIAELARSGEVLLLARHGKPALDRSVFLDSEAYVDWWAAYDAGGLAEGQRAPAALVSAAAACTVLVTSPLRRARETVALAAPGREAQADPVYREAALPPPHLPRWLRLRPRLWGVIARFWWWMGHHRQDESRAEAEVRAGEAARALDLLARQSRSAALFAHGWFNRMIRPELEALGFRCVHDGGDSHWSFRVYHRSGR